MKQAPEIGARTACPREQQRLQESFGNRKSMKKPAAQVVLEKQASHYQPTANEIAQGFKGWNSRGYLPHFDAPGACQFITYRLADSIPENLRGEWSDAMKLTDDREKFRRMEGMLDRGFGTCSLRKPEIAGLVQENLCFHDGTSYRLLGWVIMPNHVHVLAEMWKPLGEVIKKWKSYTAKEANKFLGQNGTAFWQADYFDRYIRDQQHFRRVVRYIENNPVNARLVRESTQWRWSSAPFREQYGADEPPKIQGKASVYTGMK